MVLHAAVQSLKSCNPHYNLSQILDCKHTTELKLITFITRVCVFFDDEMVISIAEQIIFHM